VWQVVLIFLFAAALAWLVAHDVTMTTPRDDEWDPWLTDLAHERRRQRRLARRSDRRPTKADIPVIEDDGLPGRDARRALGGERDPDPS
jgi:hypothetical protein